MSSSDRAGSPGWSFRMLRSLLLSLVAFLAACSPGGSGTTVTIGQGAPDPVTAVEELRSLLAAGDFSGAGSLAVPGQAVLASLAEGAAPSTVAAALAGGDGEVAANFWSGFAQGVGGALSQEATLEDLGTTTADGIEFFVVGITPEGGGRRMMVTRDVDGQRIDLFASFGAGLAEGMIPSVDLLLTSPNEDSGQVLAALQEVVPSLMVAARDETLSSDASQRILQLVEMITRAG
ncbi:MAG TPA: hypothetical protein VFV13_08395 [Acidimicrobiia bacterium]|nr:hypothetical protein [Acidimicrobiia bacterium]